MLYHLLSWSCQEIGNKIDISYSATKRNASSNSFFRKDGPAVMVYNRSGKNDPIHHPDFAVMVKERCKELGVECQAYGVQGTGLDQLPRDKIFTTLR